MTYLAIVAWTAANRVAKYQDYPTQSEATAHVVRVLTNFPYAFIAPHPGVGPRDWLVDSVAKTLSISVPASVLIEGKAAKRDEFKAEGLVRIVAQESSWDDFEWVGRLASIWTRLGVAPANQTLAKDIYLYVKNTAIPKVNAVTTQVDLDAIDPTATDPFGDGTSWPT